MSAKDTISMDTAMHLSATIRALDADIATLLSLLREARPYVAPAQIGAGDLYGPPQHVGVGTAQQELLARIDAALESR